jgi:hypothetical protein
MPGRSMVVQKDSSEDEKLLCNQGIRELGRPRCLIGPRFPRKVLQLANHGTGKDIYTRTKAFEQIPALLPPLP